MKNNIQQEISFPDADKGYRCPCCNSYIKQYHRNLNCNMAMTMIALFVKKKFGYVRVEEFLRVNGYPRSGDFSYLIHWGFLERMEGERVDGSKKNGFYKLTDSGREFVQGKTTAQKTMMYLKGECQGFRGPEINIVEALGEKFNYNELMGR